MAGAKMTRDEILAAAAQIHFDEAWELQEAKTELNKKIAANKSALSNEKAAGHLTDEQVAEYDELYPVREKATAAERVEALRESLAKAEERAAKEAGTTEDSGTEPDDELADAA